MRRAPGAKRHPCRCLSQAEPGEPGSTSATTRVERGLPRCSSLFHRELACSGGAAVLRDLDLVLAGRKTVWLADLECGGGRAVRRDRLAGLVHGLAVLVRPFRRERDVRG